MEKNKDVIWTVIKIIKWGSGYLKEKGIDSPRLTIELLLSNVLNVTRFELYIQFERPLLLDELSKLKGYINRRVNREPIQYILEEEHFYRRVFKVTPNVLIPRPETEILVEEAIRRSGNPIRCLDVGTGSGCIAITYSLERPETEVVAIDVSSKAIEVAKENSKSLNANNVSFFCLDFFDDNALKSLGSFDLIISNPPYISKNDISTLQIEVRDFEPQIALTDRADGFMFYKRFLQVSKYLLRHSGNLFLEIGFGQSIELQNIFNDSNEFSTISVLDDLSKIPRILWAQKK